ncbi:hypothetical protein [Bacillus thuringiensis]|uniref:hypothetical protein n=1 Tax=Bacillus thuringiensis TaxID=1428 RepID=UPI0015D4F8A1|nr:hypothetical protein [Bacillus thuringiensis]
MKDVYMISPSHPTTIPLKPIEVSIPEYFHIYSAGSKFKQKIIYQLYALLLFF